MSIVEIIRPNGAGDSTQWGTATPPNWECVNEVIPDDDDYVGIALILEALDLYALENPTRLIDGDIVHGVTEHFRWSDIPDGQIAPALKENGVVTTGTSLDGGGGIREDEETWTVRPSDDEDWEYADILGLQAGQKHQTATGGAGVYQLYVSVEFSVPAPTDLIATAITWDQIDLEWTPGGTNEDGFNIYRAGAVGGPFVLIDTVGAGIIVYSDVELDAETTYWYKVTAYHGDCESDPSNTANDTTPIRPVPADPTNLAAVALSRYRIRLTWDDNSTDEEHFRIEWSLSATGPWETVTDVDPDTETYIDDGLEPGTTYFYRIRAWSSWGTSGWSNIASATTHTYVLPPSSTVGTVRETIWAVTPTSGEDPNKLISGILFFPCKMEDIQSQGESQPEESMIGNREIGRIERKSPSIGGPLRFTGGPETMGTLLTSMFGNPQTTELADSSGGDAVYEHIWYPGLNAQGDWPTSISIESQFYDIQSKLVQGAVVTKIGIYLSIHGPMVLMPEVVAKRIVWLYPDGTAGSGSGTFDPAGKTRPAVMTPNHVTIDEPYWHGRHIAPFPLIDSVEREGIQDIYLEPRFAALSGEFLGGGGDEIATYLADKFNLTGRMTLLVEDKADWERFYGRDYFDLSFSLVSEVIQGAHSYQLDIDAYHCKLDKKQRVNQIGDLVYQFGFSASHSPTESKSCRFRLVNTTSSY